MAAEIQPYDKDTFISVLSSLIGIKSTDEEYAGIMEELWSAYDTKYKFQQLDPALIPDIVVTAKDEKGKLLTPKFDAKFGAYLKIRDNPNNTTGITSIRDYVNAKASYKDLFAMYNLKDIATDENINKFIEGNVSASEAQARMSAAYDAINNADTVLKQQLGSYGINDSELAKALLTGKEGALELENRIKTANIRAAEVESGITSILGANELAKQGLTRQQVRKGLSEIKNIMPGTEAAAARAGIDTKDLQKELEGEALLGLASQRRKKIASTESSRFQGKSGTANISLGKSSAGSI